MIKHFTTLLFLISFSFEGCQSQDDLSSHINVLAQKDASKANQSSSRIAEYGKVAFPNRNVCRDICIEIIFLYAYNFATKYDLNTQYEGKIE